MLKMQTFVLQDGLSPLYISSVNGHLDVVKTLIEAGANINQANKVSTHICSVIAGFIAECKTCPDKMS